LDPRVFLEPLERLPDPLPIPVLARPFEVAIRPPGSKSLTNRALLLAALAEGESVLHGALTSADDARVMIGALEQLGALITVEGEDVRVMGVGGRWRVPRAGVTLNLENAGTATRFLTAAAMLAPPPPESGPITIDGNARMRERPIRELVEMLRGLGVSVEYAGQEGFPPVRVRGVERAGGADLSIGATASSQFVSALLMAGAFLDAGMTLRFTAELTSASYVEMTVGLMRELGVRVEWCSELNGVRVHPTRLYRFDYEVEPDASGATYWWAAAALSPGSSCLVPGIGEGSLQGDVRFAEELERIGAALQRGDDGTRVGGAGAALGTIVTGLSRMPDAAMTLAAVCCFAPGRSVIGGLRTLRVKETDRLAALVAELSKVGVRATTAPWSANTPASSSEDEALCVETPADGIDCSPGAPRVEFDTYKDHRMAMALALIGLRRPNVLIRDPACVAKTYPTYWKDFAKLYGVA
jgi:3-phosphoshikimate 1-carboxyvinyltransferase